MACADDSVRIFIAEQFRTLIRHKDFDNFLHGNIKGPEGRVDIIRSRLEALAVLPNRK